MTIVTIKYLNEIMVSKLAFGALMLLDGRHEGHLACKKTEWWDAVVVICLGQGADFYMAQLTPLPLTISCCSKSRLVLPSWFYLSGSSSPGWSQKKSKRAVKWLCVGVMVLK